MKIEDRVKEVKGKLESDPSAYCIKPDELVTVVRQPGDYRKIEIPYSHLADFHLSDVSGDVGAVSGNMTRYARMMCDRIPESAEFAHSCKHGPPPHLILVCIVKSHNPEIHE